MRSPAPIPRTVFGRRWQQLPSLRKNKDGVTAIEFGLVIVPFLALLFATFEVALVYFATYTLENATEQAAREIRTGQVQADAAAAVEGGGSYDCAVELKAKVCSRLPAFMNCDTDLWVDIRSFGDFAGASSGGPTAVNGDGEMEEGFEQCQTGTGGSIVLVNVYYRWNLIARLPRFTGGTGPGASSVNGLDLSNLADGSRLLSASTAFRNEPF